MVHAVSLAQEILVYLGVEAMPLCFAFHSIGCQRPGSANKAQQCRFIVNLASQRLQGLSYERQAAAGII